MDENGKTDDRINKGGQREYTEYLLSQVSPDIENRDIGDVQLLVQAAEISSNPLDKRIDLWGQAIDAAYRLAPPPGDIQLWIGDAIYLARQQLGNRIKQLKLDPSLVENALDAIITIYQVGSVLYKKHNLEAFRVSQICYYHYHSLIDMKGTDSEDKEAMRAYVFALSIQATRFANIANCHHECLVIARSALEVFKAMNTNSDFDFFEDESSRFFNNALFLLPHYASIAAKAIGRFPGALDWSLRAEPYVSSLENPGLKSCYWDTRGSVLLELGRADEALTYYKKAMTVPGMTPQEVNTAKIQLALAKEKITGEINIGVNAFLSCLSNDQDIERFNQLIDAAVTGSLKSNEKDETFKIMEKLLDPAILESLGKKTDMPGLSARIAGKRDQFIVVFARAAIENNDYSQLEKLIPEIKQVAESDSPAQLEAGFFLVRYRQDKGETITWEAISPLVSRLFDLEKTSIIKYILDLSAILTFLDEKELLKGAPVIADLLKEITFDDEDKTTPTAVVQETAFTIGHMDAFFTILAMIAGVVPDNAGWWAEHISRLKYLSSYRAQRLQKESELFRFFSKLPLNTVRRIKNTAESLTRHSLETKGGDDSFKKKEIELMTLLYPLYSHREPPRNPKKLDFDYPEIIHIEISNFFQMKKPGAPVISVVYADNNWGADFPEVEIDKINIKEYMAFLKRPVFLDFIIEVGLKLKRTLLPVPGDSNLPWLMGVRSTGIYHRIPLDALPLSINEQTGEVTHWVGEKMNSVLLTGQNKDLFILEKQLSIKNIAVFANSSFGGRFPDLPGVKKETEAIENITRTKTGVSVELYRDFASNRENFLRLSGEKAPQIIHIATHGIARAQYPSSSFIALSGKDSYGYSILGAVGYHDIMLMDLRQCDLVVLSACSTHEGKSILGEGIMGLAWAFKAAGAKAVIGTRWPVNDRAAVEFWSKFYEYLCSGVPIGRAFQGARLHIMKQEKWRHPFYWGVFQLIV